MINEGHIGERPLMLEESYCPPNQSLALFRPKYVSPNVLVQDSSLHSILNRIAAGFGCIVLPEMIPRSRSGDNLRFIPVSDPGPHRQIILGRRSGDSTARRGTGLSSRGAQR